MRENTDNPAVDRIHRLTKLHSYSDQAQLAVYALSTDWHIRYLYI